MSDVSLLLRRTGFGTTGAEIGAATARGYEATVEAQGGYEATDQAQGGSAGGQVYGTLLERVLDTDAGRVLDGSRPALDFL